ncbi:exodeoxyribonuclease VII large subunit [Alcaligenaceae bacterium]|nr:exodeoxyribonuclease VII large subunit [Alcaligenaceae bacterium]
MQYPENEVWTVAQLNQQVAQLLQTQFSRLWVRGEISNFTQAASGHWYFSIKDQAATVRAVMFRGRALATGLQPKAGDKFEFRVTVSLYEPRGDYQVQVESMRRTGRGDLHEAFLALKEKLAAQGWFDPERKRDIPPMPRAIGVVTSLGAAALHDVVSALQRRAPHVPVIIYPSPVQGADAAAQLIKAMQTAIARAEVDTLLLVRGGGSLEDLWSFNDEALAHTIASSPIPVISGVGHETDFSIADFVSDLRAPTPTAAAELACRPRQDLLDKVQALCALLSNQQQRVFERASLRLDRAVGRLVSPKQRLVQQGESLLNLQNRLGRAALQDYDKKRVRFIAVKSRLVYVQPQLQHYRQDVQRQLQQLSAAGQRALDNQRRRYLAAVQTLHALNPEKILERGYAIVRNEQQDIVKNALDLSVGERLSVELGRGSVLVTVTQAHALL